MTLATSITSPDQISNPLFKSALQYWKGRRVCFTVGFDADIEGWETIKADRMNVGCLDGIIVVASSTLRMQRTWKPNVEPQTFLVAMKGNANELGDVRKAIGSSQFLFNAESFEFDTSLMVASVKDWKRLYQCIEHRRLGEVTGPEWDMIINDDVNTSFRVDVLPQSVCATSGKRKGDKLYIGNKLVCFDNTLSHG